MGFVVLAATVTVTAAAGAVVTVKLGFHEDRIVAQLLYNRLLCNHLTTGIQQFHPYGVSNKLSETNNLGNSK